MIATDLFGEPAKSAEFSADRRYRYVLRRIWAPDLSACVFIGLNPSTADETQDDPTIRRCIGFARRWGHGRLVMLNLYAWRSTDPRGLWAPGVEPIGRDNDRHILDECRRAAIVVGAWGRNAGGDRINDMCIKLGEARVRIHCLDETRAGQPRHPLYLHGDLKPRVWRSW